MKFKEWLKEERIDRIEKDTSQDMCPTYGGAIFYNFVMFALWATIIPIVLSIK